MELLQSCTKPLLFIVKNRDMKNDVYDEWMCLKVKYVEDVYFCFRAIIQILYIMFIMLIHVENIHVFSGLINPAFIQIHMDFAEC